SAAEPRLKPTRASRLGSDWRHDTDLNQAYPSRKTVRGTGTTSVILDEVPWLGAYFAQRVIGGSGAFVHSVADRSSFVHAITAKLKREIANAAEQESSAIQKLPD
ncbi:DUF1194 domain-containing protein, partial [Azospirillum argentinense]